MRINCLGAFSTMLGVAGMLGACAAPVPTFEGPAVPVDALRAQVNNSESWGIRLGRHRGIWIEADGTAYVVSQGTRQVVTQSRVGQLGPDQVCLEPQGSWTGACMDAFNTPEGRMCRIVFGNGHSHVDTCEVVSSRWFDT